MTIDQHGRVEAAEAPGGPAGGLVVPLQALDRDAVAVAGGKGANLGELIRAGFPVPPGFCLTTSAYTLATAGAGLEPTLAALATLPPGDREGQATLAARVRETILATPVPEAVQEALRDALGALVQGAPLAVRSSATAEDLPFASFAGQQDTALNVVGADAVLDAVRRCWASLWTERAVVYRAANGIDPRGVRLAVVVQLLVDAAVAGVLFTADPLTGRRRRAVIDASPGLGEAVVSGAVTPDHFVVDSRRGDVLERRRGEAGVAIVPTPGGGTQRVALAARTDGGAGEWSRLSDAQLVGLARLGAQVEARFGAPQDVEFAFDHQGRLWLTQARPITTLFPLPPGPPPGSSERRGPRRSRASAASDFERGAAERATREGVGTGAPADEDDLRVYFSFNVAQGVPQPFTPAGVQAFRLIASGIAAALGAGPADPAAGPALLQEAAGRLFLDITGALRSTLGRRVVLALLDRAEARSAVLLRGVLDDPRLAPRPARRALAWARRAPGGARILSRVVRAVVDPEKARAEVWGLRQALLAAGAIAPDAGAPHPEGSRIEATSRPEAPGPRPSRASGGAPAEVEGAQRATSEGVQQASDLGRGGDERATPGGVNAGAMARVEHAQRLLLTWPGRIVPRVLPLLVAGLGSLGLAWRLLGDLAGPEERDAVTRGLPHNPTTEMDLALWALARQVREDGGAAGEVRAGPPARLAAAYREGLLPPPLQGELEAFLQRYGHRAVAEIDLGLPRWGEDPSYLLGALANYLQLGDTAQGPDVQFRQAATRAEAMARELVRRAAGRGRLRALAVRFFLGRGRALAGARELPKFLLVLLLAQTRATLAPVGEALVAAGRLEAAGDLWFLTLPETRRAVLGGGPDLRPLVRARRQRYEDERRRRHVPRLLLSDGTEPEMAAPYPPLPGSLAGAAAPLPQSVAALPRLGRGPRSSTREPSGRGAPATVGGYGAALRGSPASAGQATGRARVVLDPLGARLEPGDILVAPSTDPGWTPLFLTAGGLVMEMGGAMSHGAVVAREYGIPAVVGLAGATERIPDGATILVDGTAGTVVEIETRGAPG